MTSKQEQTSLLSLLSWADKAFKEGHDFLLRTKKSFWYDEIRYGMTEETFIDSFSAPERKKLLRGGVVKKEHRYDTNGAYILCFYHASLLAPQISRHKYFFEKIARILKLA